MGGIVDSIFGGGKAKGYRDLQRYINEGMGQRKEYEQRAESALSPYTGNPRIQNLYEQALSQQANPQEFYNSLMGGYQQSPFAKYQTDAGMNTIQHALSASGMHGSGDELRALQENAQNISSQDQQQYLNNLLGINRNYLTGLGGLESQESEHGYGANTNIANLRNLLGGSLAGDLSNIGSARANEDVARSGGLNNLLGMIPGLGGMLPGRTGNFFQGLSNLF